MTVDGRDVLVREWGLERGTPVLHLHALGPAASGALTALIAAPLVERGLRLVAPDGPGFGGSQPLREPGAYALDALAERAWAIADALGVERPILLGHSWGGAIACHAAAAWPARARALVLLDAGHLDYRDVPGVDADASIEDLVEQSEARRWHLEGRAELEALLEIEDAARRTRIADVLAEGLEDDGAGGLIAITPGSVRGPVLHHLANARQTGTWDAIADARIPTLLLLATEPADAAELNRAAGARFVAAIPTAEVVELQGVTHSMITDLEDALGELVAEWLERHALL